MNKPDTKLTLGQQWTAFNTMVIPYNAPKVQRVEMRRAFYAGAEAMMRIFQSIQDDSVSEDQGLQILDRTLDELVKFGELLQQGKA